MTWEYFVPVKAGYDWRVAAILEKANTKRSLATERFFAPVRLLTGAKMRMKIRMPGERSLSEAMRQFLIIRGLRYWRLYTEREKHLQL